MAVAQAAEPLNLCWTCENLTDQVLGSDEQRADGTYRLFICRHCGDEALRRLNGRLVVVEER